MESNTYKIIHVNDHYEVYIDGKFCCSAGTIQEAVKEVDDNE